MNNETTKAAAWAAASEIANLFAHGFFDDRMVSDIAAIIARHMQPAPDPIAMPPANCRQRLMLEGKPYIADNAREQP